MTPSEFRNAWIEVEDNLRPVSLPALSKLNLTQDAIDFLSICGLPDSAAPFLSFHGDQTSKYERIDILPNLFDFLGPEYSQFVVIGSDGSGNIIAVNTNIGCIIEWLDHEDYFSAQFMNSSINQLANYLLALRSFISTVNNGLPAGKTFYTEFTNEQFNTLRDIFENLDKRAINEGFWKEELDMLLVNREALKE